MSSSQSTYVEKIIINDNNKHEYTELEKKIIEITNMMIDKKFCGINLTLDNGFKISIKNHRFAKQLDIPMA